MSNTDVIPTQNKDFFTFFNTDVMAQSFSVEVLQLLRLFPPTMFFFMIAKTKALVKILFLPATGSLCKVEI